ncbi:hypothetical protein RIF29_20400 [Crotalaria pallida]|uniref:Uncharacterized protein n=1 Tax=Crotalaria pallida TaxID=3830 RepID=A0AAN9F116_CROPI
MKEGEIKLITKFKMLRSFVGKIRNGLSLLVARKPEFSYFNEDDQVTDAVPQDVMEGYFAVLAIKGEEAQRFILELNYLNDPAFLGLLDQAKEEYGFRQKGALAVPCRPQELQKILDHRRA